MTKTAGATPATPTQEAPDGARRTPKPAAAPYFQTVPLGLIDVPEGRLSAVRPARVETIAKTSKAVGRLQPINLVAEENGRFTLLAGAKRLAASRAAGESIDARVHPVGSLGPDQRRLVEIIENVDRQDLTKLERAEYLAALKEIHERLYPEAKNGGRRGNQHTGGEKRQNEIFSFSQSAAKMTGLSRRAIEIAVAIVSGLTADSKARVRDTWLDDHQAGLRLLSEQAPELQARVLDLLFADPPAAGSVADALALAEGKRLAKPAEKLWATTLGNWSRLTERQRAEFLDANEQAIRQHAKKRGWW